MGKTIPFCSSFWALGVACRLALFAGLGAISLAGAEPFSIVILPDTQKYTIGGRYGDLFAGQTEWIQENADVLNLKFVIHEGDVVETASAEDEWQLADKVFRTLDGKVPYTISVGNHDMDVEKRDKALFNRYFPPSRFASQPGYGGHMESQPANRYHFLEAAGMHFLILSIEYRPPAEVLEWANGVVAGHPNHRVIVNTHSFLKVNERNEEGETIWNGFARKHPNIFLVVSGHLSVGRRADEGDHGNTVNQVLANYQGHRRGGNGWLRILRFIPEEDRIEVSTYSTVLQRFMGPGDPKWSRLEDNAFNLYYDMAEPGIARIPAASFIGQSAKFKKDPALAYDPIEAYGEDNILGWTVYVHQDLEFDHPQLHADVLAELKRHLTEIERVIPEKALKSLRAIPIWIELDHPKHPCACYHPDADWLEENEMNPKKQGAVEIANARNFIDWSKRQPSMVLHELAHGYHFRFLRKDHAGIEQAFEKATAGGRYEKVGRRDGREMRHYALTNRFEYFAEATEAFFGENDYFPYNRKELRAFDPDGYSMIVDTWQVTLDKPKLAVESVKKIWDAAPHNAFTDLVQWRDQFYCAFREGQGHAGDLGKLRVLRSRDGGEWESVSLVELDDYDLRDAALSVMPDDRLLLLGGAQQNSETGRSTRTVVSMSDDGAAWSEPTMVTDPGRWLWRITWNGDSAYGVSYAAPEGKPWSQLLKSQDGLHFETIQPQLLGDGWPTEARIRFDHDGNALCLHRRDGESNNAFFGKAKPPFTEWEWKDLGKYFGGPNMIQLPGHQWLGSGRTIGTEARTQIAWIDPEAMTLEPMLELPSGGDTSYPGMVWHDDKLWVTYYSSHEGKTSIYLAVVTVE
ncbi:MAG: metallophosphoesterase [Verrucomicrobiae bacterium]|nr:metallophosphoesterase [Verrucomicrobiae bacterium]